MVLKRSGMKVEKRDNVRDGKGTLTFTHFVDGKGAVQSNTNLFAELVIPPGGSIGYHPHNDEAEFYIILEGTARVNDNGTEAVLSKGDVMFTGGGAFHSIENSGAGNLVFHAAIIKG